MHTYLDDGSVSPKARVREAWYDGLDIVAMTPHIGVHKTDCVHLKDYNLPYKLAESEGKKVGVLVIQSAEITRRKPFGHMNALFLKDCNVFDENRYLVDENGVLLRDKNGDRIPNRATEMKDFEAAEAQGAFIIWNHPGWPDRKSTLYSLHKKLIEEKRIHAVELFNSSEWYPRVLDWFDTYKLPMMANTDIHGISANIYNRSLRPMTLIFAKDQGLDSIKEALVNDLTLAYGYGILCGSEQLLSDLFKACVSVKVIRKGADGKGASLMLTNNSSIPFRLSRNGGNPFYLDPFTTVSITGDAGEDSVKVKVVNMFCSKDINPEIVLSF
jgi:predicted metal-dependent phosphoesterase TrpH